jgi:hypothetical protein
MEEITPEMAAQLALLQEIIDHQERRISELEAENARLRQRIAELEGLSDDADDAPAAPVFKANRPIRSQDQPRKKRAQNYGRKRETPTRQVTHAIDQCRGCGCTLRGGSVKRTRQVLHIPIAPVEVIEHVFIERRCPLCGKREVPGAEVLAGEVLGQHRVSAQTMAFIATLREVGRLPLETIQWFLETFCQLHLGRGELVEILHDVAVQAAKLVTEIREGLRQSPVVHGDETTWREDGSNGYFWGFTTPDTRYFTYRHSRSGEVVLDVLGGEFEGVLVSDFYAGYNRMLGLHQRCWSHLLHDIHDLKEKHPDDHAVQAWGKAVHTVYLHAVQYAQKHREDPLQQRVQAQHRFERQLMELCQPHLSQDVPQTVLCQRVERFLPELFVFVADPRVPPDNNAAERGLRPLAVCRKISGGTRSPLGSYTRGALATIFGTWKLRGLNPFSACLQLLLSPQI